MNNLLKEVKKLKVNFNNLYVSEASIGTLEISNKLKNLLVYKNIDIHLGEVTAYIFKENTLILIQNRFALTNAFETIEIELNNNVNYESLTYKKILNLLNGMIYLFNEDIVMYEEDVDNDSKLMIKSLLKNL